MQLIRVLLVAVAIAVLLSGITFFFGSAKQEKGNGARFLLATIGGAVWSIAIMVFLKMPNASESFAHTAITCIIAGVTLSDIGLLAYLGWPYKNGKVLTATFSCVGLVLVVLLAYDSSLFYSAIDLSGEYTRIFVQKGWYYYTLIAYFFVISFTFSAYLQKRIKKTTHKDMKTGLTVFYAGLSTSGILALVFNLILISSHPHLTWIGPMSTGITVLTFYYSVVKFRTVSMSSKWLEVMSYAILLITAAIIYLLAFYIIFTALFGIPNPTNEVLTLNIVMAVFLLILMPTLTELANFMKANFYTDRIELGYITNKLEKIPRGSYESHDVARFLADTMHYSYVAIVINGRLYASNNARFTSAEAIQIGRLKVDDNIWVKNLAEDIAKPHEISRVARLTSKTGKEIGKVVFGKRLASSHLSRRDLVKHEAILGVLSCVVEENIK